jgi:hypothetical protein
MCQFNQFQIYNDEKIIAWTDAELNRCSTDAFSASWLAHRPGLFRPCPPCFATGRCRFDYAILVSIIINHRHVITEVR